MADGTDSASCPDCRYLPRVTCGMHVSAVLRIEPINVSVDSHHGHSQFDFCNRRPMTQKVIEAVGCRFIEYRGEGRPVKGNPLASPGDVYFDMKEQPYTVWSVSRILGGTSDVHGRKQKLQTSGAGSYSIPIGATSRVVTYIRLRRLP